MKPSQDSMLLKPADLSNRLRDSWFGKLYIRELKHRPKVRRVVAWLWRHVFHTYRLIWIHRNAPKFPLLAMSSIMRGSQPKTLALSETLKVKPPVTLPSLALRAPSPHVIFPSIVIVNLQDCIVTGGTNLVIHNNSVVHHDLYDFSFDYTSEELNGRTHIWPTQARIAWLTYLEPVHRLERAASFVDACASNYAHWLTEVLPRIHMFCLNCEEEGTPLLIDEGLHANQITSINLASPKPCGTIMVPKGFSVSVTQLDVVSPTGYIPFEPRSNKYPNPSHGTFSGIALKSMRRHILTKVRTSTGRIPDKIYIRRNSTIRNLVNLTQIEDFLTTAGFTFIEPETLSFEDQVSIFHNASIVVGATGAAMANLIFCPQSTLIVILISNAKYTPYFYWQKIACSVGNNVTYVIGKTSGLNPGVHDDFEIDLSLLSAALSNS